MNNPIEIDVIRRRLNKQLTELTDELAKVNAKINKAREDQKKMVKMIDQQKIIISKLEQSVKKENLLPDENEGIKRQKKEIINLIKRFMDLQSTKTREFANITNERKKLQMQIDDINIQLGKIPSQPITDIAQIKEYVYNLLSYHVNSESSADPHYYDTVFTSDPNLNYIYGIIDTIRRTHWYSPWKTYSFALRYDQMNDLLRIICMIYNEYISRVNVQNAFRTTVDNLSIIPPAIKTTFENDYADHERAKQYEADKLSIAMHIWNVNSFGDQLVTEDDVKKLCQRDWSSQYNEVAEIANVGKIQSVFVGGNKYKYLKYTHKISNIVN